MLFQFHQQRGWNWSLLLLLASLFQIIKSSGKFSTDKDLAKYAASCTFTFENKTKVSNSCVNALFSPNSFNIKGKAVISSDDLCSALQRTTSSSQSVIFLANRGKCSFDEKAKNAVMMKASGVIIVNSDPDAFPMGAMSPDLTFPVPVVMIGNSSIIHEFLNVLSASDNIVISLRKENSELKPVDATTNLWLISLIGKSVTAILIAGGIVFLVCLYQFSEIVLNEHFWERTSAISSASETKFCFSDLLIAIVVTSAISFCFIFSRIATFRLLSFPSNNNPPVTLFESYYHQETDEIIFSV
jgi:hypothetical protein